MAKSAYPDWPLFLIYKCNMVVEIYPMATLAHQGLEVGFRFFK